MMTLTTSPAVPQGLLLDRGGCHGTPAATVRVKVREVAQTHPVRTTLANINDARPHLLGHLATRVHDRLAAHSAGCVGSCGVAVKVQATGCSGGSAFVRMPVGPPAAVVVAPAAPKAVEGRFRDHAAIRAFLVRHGVPEAKLAAHEASVGGTGNVDWLGLLMAFVKGGLQAVLALLGGG